MAAGANGMNDSEPEPEPVRCKNSRPLKKTFNPLSLVAQVYGLWKGRPESEVIFK